MVNLLYVVLALTSVAYAQSCDKVCKALDVSEEGICNFSCGYPCPSQKSGDARKAFITELGEEGHYCSSDGDDGISCLVSETFGDCVDHSWLCDPKCPETQNIGDGIKKDVI